MTPTYSSEGNSSEVRQSISDDSSDGINVVLRLRPLSNNEENSKEKTCIRFPGKGQVVVEGTSTVKLFKFNVAFESEATQTDVFEHSGVKRLVELSLEGYSCTCFAYGQTGSGKTHTLTGPPQEFLFSPEPDPINFGVIPRAFVYLYQLLKNNPGTTFRIHVNYFEIYNEQIIDLLNPHPMYPLNVRWRKQRGFYVDNLFVIECESVDDLMAVMETGMKNRSFNPTNPNEFSSRSHSMLTLMIDAEMTDQVDPSITYTKHGKLTFVDLAGSEKFKDGVDMSSEQLLETNNINKSLLVLGNCISALSDAKKTHIPYRDSKLTKLLADSLGGNGVTLMIACISPATSSSAETMNTMRYASRARKIKNQPTVRLDPTGDMVRQLKQEVKKLRDENNYLREQRNSTVKSQVKSDNQSRHDQQNNNNQGKDLEGQLVTRAPGDDEDSTESLTPRNRQSDFDDQFTERNDGLQRGIQRGGHNSRTHPPLPPIHAKKEGGGYSDEEDSSRLLMNTTDRGGGRKKRDRSATSGGDGVGGIGTPKSQLVDNSLYEMLQEYMVENEGLRSENSDLTKKRDTYQTEQDNLKLENDKLNKHLEEMRRLLEKQKEDLERARLQPKATDSRFVSQTYPQNQNPAPGHAFDYQPVRGLDPIGQNYQYPSKWSGQPPQQPMPANSLPNNSPSPNPQLEVQYRSNIAPSAGSNGNQGPHYDYHRHTAGHGPTNDQYQTSAGGPNPGWRAATFPSPNPAVAPNYSSELDQTPYNYPSNQATGPYQYNPYLDPSHSPRSSPPPQNYHQQQRNARDPHQFSAVPQHPSPRQNRYYPNQQQNPSQTSQYNTVYAIKKASPARYQNGISPRGNFKLAPLHPPPGPHINPDIDPEDLEEVNRRLRHELHVLDGAIKSNNRVNAFNQDMRSYLG